MQIEQQRPRIAAMTARPKKPADSQAQKPIITADEDAIEGKITVALARPMGLQLLVRNVYANELGESTITITSNKRPPEETEVSDVSIGLETLCFRIGAIEYRVVGADHVRWLNKWLLRKTAVIAKSGTQPDRRILFKAYGTPALN